MKKIILAFALLFSMFACKSLETNSSELKVVLKNEITYTHKGTKSEGSEGKLKINSYYIPSIFYYITDSEKTYKYESNSNLWGRHKYFPVDERIKDNNVSTDITGEELSKGYYLGIYKLKGTPGNWLHVQWNNGSAYIDANKIETVLKEKPFSELKNYDSNSFIYDGPPIIKN